MIAAKGKRRKAKGGEQAKKYDVKQQGDGRGQRTDDRGQRTDDRGQRTDDG
jgi:hypothetical protein